jgi:hypothetical protein
MSAPSLLSFLDAPIVVGDRDGRAAYVNPAFETHFHVSAEQVTGEPLSALFEGGGREAVLKAVADVCESGASTRLRVRHGGIGFAGLASPIVADDARVGFVILLLETGSEDERVVGLYRQLTEPMEELSRVLDELLEPAGGRGLDHQRVLVEDGVRALGRLRKFRDEMGQVLTGRSSKAPRGASCDAAQTLREAAAALLQAYEAAGVALEVVAPSDLPRARCEAGALKRVLEDLLQTRLSESTAGSRVSASLRGHERDGRRSLILAVADRHADHHPGNGVSLALTQAVQRLGADLRTAADSSGGRTTAIRLPVAKQ